MKSKSMQGNEEVVDSLPTSHNRNCFTSTDLLLFRLSKLPSFLKQEVISIAPDDDNTSKKPTDRKDQKKSVSFVPRSKCLLIPSHHDMNKEQKADIWTTLEETNASEATIRKTVQIARKEKFATNRTFVAQRTGNVCIRGLEQIICPARYGHLQARRQAIVSAVLGAQEKLWQKERSTSSPGSSPTTTRTTDHQDLLREISTKYSHEDVNDAIIRGAKDEAYIRGMRGCQASSA